MVFPILVGLLTYLTFSSPNPQRPSEKLVDLRQCIPAEGNGKHTGFVLKAGDLPEEALVWHIKMKMKNGKQLITLRTEETCAPEMNFSVAAKRWINTPRGIACSQTGDLVFWTDDPTAFPVIAVGNNGMRIVFSLPFSSIPLPSHKGDCVDITPKPIVDVKIEDRGKMCYTQGMYYPDGQGRYIAGRPCVDYFCHKGNMIAKLASGCVDDDPLKGGGCVYRGMDVPTGSHRHCRCISGYTYNITDDTCVADPTISPPPTTTTTTTPPSTTTTPPPAVDDRCASNPCNNVSLCTDTGGPSPICTCPVGVLVSPADDTCQDTYQCVNDPTCIPGSFMQGIGVALGDDPKSILMPPRFTEYPSPHQQHGHCSDFIPGLTQKHDDVGIVLARSNLTSVDNLLAVGCLFPIVAMLGPIKDGQRPYRLLEGVPADLPKAAHKYRVNSDYPSFLEEEALTGLTNRFYRHRRRLHLRRRRDPLRADQRPHRALWYPRPIDRVLLKLSYTNTDCTKNVAVKRGRRRRRHHKGRRMMTSHTYIVQYAFLPATEKNFRYHTNPATYIPKFRRAMKPDTGDEADRYVCYSGSPGGFMTKGETHSQWSYTGDESDIKLGLSRVTSIRRGRRRRQQHRRSPEEEGRSSFSPPSGGKPH